jgi:hypothetical protein
MALRLRRGTDAERLTITPLEGELIYTTDTEKLFIGDGTTAGGNPVDTDSITDELADLTDVDLTGLQDGDTLVYNLSNTRFEPGSQATAIGDLTDVDTSSVSTGDVLKWNGVNFVPGAEGGFEEGTTYPINIDGDVNGSVFADDSTLLVDGVAGVITAPRYHSSLNNTIYVGDLADGDLSRVYVQSVNNASTMRLERQSATDLTTNQALDYGRIQFGRDDVNGERLTAIIVGRDNALLFVSDASGAFNDGTDYFCMKEKKFGIGTITPAQELDVNGNGAFAGFVQFGSLTSTDRDALTAANGMVIYNTTNNKFEGYQNGGWINLDDGTAAS